MSTKSVLIMLCVCLAGAARADIFEGFGADAAGWRIVSYPFRSYVANPSTQEGVHDAAFGNPAGSLRVGDVYGETGVAAPVSFLGDRSAAYGHNLTYDIFVRYADVGETYPAVILCTSGMSIYYDALAPVVGVWESRTIPLTESGWRRSGTNQVIDEATMRGVLADLTALYIYTEWDTGPDDTSVDNVRLGGVVIGVSDVAAAGVTLHPCAPNPFNPATAVRFSLASAGPVRVDLLSVDGRVVRTLVSQWQEAGPHAVTWNGCDDVGRVVASGTYLCRLTAAATVQTTRVTLLK